MSETFIKIDSLQHVEMSRQTCPTNRSKFYATKFTALTLCYFFSKLTRRIHVSMTSTFQCEYCQCFTFKRCDKFKLKCTSHGGMYSAHMILNSILTLLKHSLSHL